MKIETLRLANHSRAGFIHMVYSWKPKNAKSFSLSGKQRYNYSVATSRKTDFLFEVTYFSTVKEGKYTFKNNWSWTEYCLEGKRFDLDKN